MANNLVENGSQVNLIAIGKAQLGKHPHEWVSCIEINGQMLWIKRRPLSKKNIWHRLQSIFTLLFPIPVFYPTVSLGGAESLRQEAARLRLFAAKKIPVPALLAETPEFIITSDVGIPLSDYVQNLPSYEQKQQILHKAALALSHLHQTGLCHGRPFLRDLTYQDGRIFFIDLEEDPLAVMELGQAQARDFWLFLNGVLRCYPNDLDLLVSLYKTYLTQAPIDSITALRKMVFALKPLLFMANSIAIAFGGRDLRNAISANRALEKAF